MTTQRSRLFTSDVARDKAIVAGLHPEATPAPRFSIATSYPVVGNSAVFGASFTTKSSSDQLFFGTQSGSNTANIGITSGITGCGTTACTSNNFFAVNNLYTGTPALSWAALVSGGTSASVALSGTGNQVYVLSDTGKLYCFQTAGGGPCTSWTTNPRPLTIAAGGAITPWVDTASNAIYVANGTGGVYRLNATTGTVQWGGNAFSYTGNAASSAWPLEANNILYMGDGAGYFWRIVDPTLGTTDASNTNPPTVKSSVQVTGANCTAVSSINGSASIDTTANLVFLPYDGCLFTFPHYCASTSGCSATSGTWGITGSGWTGSVPDKPFQTWPALDGTYAYWVIADLPTSSTPVSAVWKTPYSLAFVNGTTLINASSSTAGASVGSAPVVYNSQLYVGDQSGYVEDFGCASTKSSTTSVVAETTAAPGAISTGMQLDDATGDLIYGFKNASSGGGVVQFPLYEGTSTSDAGDFNWQCPSGQVACPNQLCGVGANKVQCVPAAQCNTGAACKALSAISGSSLQVGVAGSEGATVTGSQGTGSNQICPNGSVILGVLGASYGTAPSSPDNPVSGNTFDFNGACYANDSLSVTQGQCGAVNTSQNCSFVAQNSTFGDPCVGTGKHYYGWFACAPTQATAPVLCSRQNVVPKNGASDPCGSAPDAGATTCEGTCLSGFGDCNSNLQYDGCETFVNGTDPANCGSCGNVCASPSNASPTCSGGTCGYTCNSGYSSCSSACVNEQTDTNNCGSCGHVCGAGYMCNAGACSQSMTLTASGTFTVPTGVTSVSIVAIGGGGGAVYADGYGGGGGGGELCYYNNLSVTPGSTFTVVVGAGGASGATTAGNGGSTSVTFGALSGTVAGGSAGAAGAVGTAGTAAGGAGGNANAGGTCFAGGTGGSATYVVSDAGVASLSYGGGGGAGGYAGAGGNGGNASNNSCTVTAATAGAGGGGGGGGGGSASRSTTGTVVQGGGGGGVGLLGTTGTSGAAGATYCPTTNAPGSGGGGGGGYGGSAGSPAAAGAADAGTSPAVGGSYGGGAGAGGESATTSTGGNGAVRFIWGTGHSFPTGANF